MKDYIEIKNARIHNLKGVDVRIPRNKLTVITGVSGSGKSSLAFDTLYEEGKRRYLMFSGTQFMVDSVPTFDSIQGLSPTVAVEQRIIRQSNPRSTVGTRTKIGSMLGALFATYGERDPEYDDGLPLSMEMFQRNSPKGMCVKCLGAGIIKHIDEKAIYGDLSIALNEVLEGKFKLIPTWRRRFDTFCKDYRLKPDQPLSSLTTDQLLAFQYGSSKTSFQGVNFYVPTLEQTCNGISNPSYRQKLFTYNKIYAYKDTCPKCQGSGLGEQASHTSIGGRTITELETMYIKDLYEFLSDLYTERTNPLSKEILAKLSCMVDVGLHHLSLSRPVPTLSGGEIQRLFLASYIIAEMDSIIFIFDEPTIGLHEVEKSKLISIIKNLVIRGNTVIAVEHDENFMKNADYIIDLGPDAGSYGGIKIYEGGFSEFLSCRDSKTAPYLSGKKGQIVKQSYRTMDKDHLLIIQNATLHNLQNVSVELPLGLLVGVAGVSGSGKSSLISDTLVPKLKDLLQSKCATEEDDEDYNAENLTADIIGTEYIKKCFIIDQKPIGRSRTSCPATYTGIFDRIRALFAKETKLSAGLFSVNSEGGCKVCKGDGEVHYHVGFGNFIDIECEACGGTGYIPEAMEIELDGKNIRDILNMSVEEAFEFFQDKEKAITNMLLT
ncbi:MAG: transporter related [Herbinix sp.]|jgi:excinuclease ABC A subunit|nr:transporter related [Herbinix sp.]